jgi:hypothetical protein
MTNSPPILPVPKMWNPPVTPITPAEARKLDATRVVDTTKIYNGGLSLEPRLLSNVVEGPASIVELARALKNNPQLMYQYVHDNIDWEPAWGVQKGALGCLMDGRGNAFDQSMLLVALLRQAGFTANYVLGTIQLTPAEASAWWGTLPSGVTGGQSAVDYANTFAIPCTFYWDGSEYSVQMSHVWVQCVISGTTYVFDPSYKNYTQVAGLSNLATIMGYTSSALLSDVETGATIDPSGVFVQNLNRTKLRTDLATYSENLSTYIKTNMPAASLDQVLGGGEIIPATIPLLQTALPYEMPGDTTTIWTGDVPATYKITFQVEFCGINQTFTSDQLAGTRLTIWWSASYVPTLYLNGTAIQSGTAQTSGSYNTITMVCTHNAISSGEFNQTVETSLETSQYTGM